MSALVPDSLQGSESGCPTQSSEGCWTRNHVVWSRVVVRVVHAFSCPVSVGEQEFVQARFTLTVPPVTVSSCTSHRVLRETDQG